MDFGMVSYVCKAADCCFVLFFSLNFISGYESYKLHIIS